jgi:predicted deacylase
MAALRSWAGVLASRELRGRVPAVPVLNLPAFRARSPFVVPGDGKNLNRCFSGNAAGSLAERPGAAAQAGRGRRRRAALVIPTSAAVRRVFAISGLDRLIPNLTNLDEALEPAPASAASRLTAGATAPDAAETCPRGPAASRSGSEFSPV